MTRLKPIFYFSPAGTMAAVISALLVLGLFYSHAGASFGGSRDKIERYERYGHPHI